jgi:hypothetical protein
MQNNILTLPDKTSISSGIGDVAIMSMEHFEEVNSGSELTLGSAVASYIIATISTPMNQFFINQGTEIQYHTESDGINLRVGLFYVDSPKRTSRNMLKITAYDRMIRFDQDATEWVNSRNFDGETLLGLLLKLCYGFARVPLANKTIPNGDVILKDFGGEMTGRQLLGYIAEAAGSFARITVDGYLELAWYEEINQDHYRISNGSDSEAPVELAFGRELYTSDGLQYVGMMSRPYYFMNSLSFEDYSVEPVNQILIRKNDDISISEPEFVENQNTYIIEKNPILENLDEDQLSEIARNILERMRSVTYTPAKVSIPATWQVRAGDAVSIEDINGKLFHTLVMNCRRKGQKLTIQSKGSQRRNI